MLTEAKHKQINKSNKLPINSLGDDTQIIHFIFPQ